MHLRFTAPLVAATFLSFCVSTHAATLLTETFSYPDGSLVPNGGWSGHSGTPGDLLVSGGQAIVQHGTPSEDAHVIFGPPAVTGTLVADFDIIVRDDTQISGNDFEYFAHFMLDGTFDFGGRVDVVPPNDSLAGDYTLGIATTGGTAEATLPVDFSFGDTIPVTLTFDLDAGLATVTAGGFTATSTSVVLGESYDSFALRQSDSSNNETVVVDNLVVSLIPEPTAGLLALIGFAGVAIRRRG